MRRERASGSALRIPKTAPQARSMRGLIFRDVRWVFLGSAGAWFPVSRGGLGGRRVLLGLVTAKTYLLHIPSRARVAGSRCSGLQCPVRSAGRVLTIRGYLGFPAERKVGQQLLQVACLGSVKGWMRGFGK
jgi:hypothetical protein